MESQVYLETTTLWETMESQVSLEKTELWVFWRRRSPRCFWIVKCYIYCHWYLYILCPSRRRSSARDRGVALYCGLLLNRRLEVQAVLYNKAPSCKVFIWSLSVCTLVTPQIRLSYNRSNMRIATHKHLLVSIVRGNREFSRSFLYSTHSMVCQNYGL